MGTPQGGILSPLLSNIYLHELDCYMEQLKEEFEGKKKTPRVNPAYTKLASKKMAHEARKRRIPYRMPKDPECRNIKYNRYADDFVVGVNGSRKDAEQIKEKIKIFLKKRLKISMNEEKTKITSMAKSFTYLGYTFSRAIVVAKMKKNRNNKTAYKKRTKVMYTRADTEKTIQRLKQKGFCDGKG